MSFIQGLGTNEVFMILLTLVCSHVFGRINSVDMKFDISGVLVMALIFGVLGMEVPIIIGTAGLALFLACVDLSVGSSSATNLRVDFWGFVATTVTILVVVGGTVIMAIRISKLPAGLALGVMTGAVICTTSLATAKGLFGDESVISVGYGLTYMFDIISVMMFVQLVPKLLRADVGMENAKLPDAPVSKSEDDKSLLMVDDSDVSMVCVTITLGTLTSTIKVPLSGDTIFSFDTSGSAIIAGTFVSAIGYCDKIELTVPKSTLIPLHDLDIA